MSPRLILFIALGVLLAASIANPPVRDARAAPAGTSRSHGEHGKGRGVRLAANRNGLLAFNKKELVASRPGKVTIHLRNPAPLTHGVAIQGPNGGLLGKSPLITHGRTSLTLRLHPGKYTFYCPVPGHRAAGMVGTLKVK